MSLLEKMKSIHKKDADHETMSSAIINCDVELVKLGKFIHFKRFECWSYNESLGNKLSVLYLDKETKMMFHAIVHTNFVMIYPASNKTFNPQVFVDYFEQVKKSIDKNAELLTYEEWLEGHKDGACNDW